MAFNSNSISLKIFMVSILFEIEKGHFHMRRLTVILLMFDKINEIKNITYEKFITKKNLLNYSIKF